MPEAATIRLRDDTPCMEPAVTLEAFAEQTNAVAVRIEPGGDARELAQLRRLEQQPVRRACRLARQQPLFQDRHELLHGPRGVEPKL